MLNKIKLLGWFLFIWLMSSKIALAAGTVADSNPAGGGCPNYPVSESLSNLLENFNGEDASKNLGSVRCFAFEITKLAFSFGAILAVIMLLWAAFLYVTSWGEEAKAETAKKTAIWSIAGLVLILMAYTIMNVVNKEFS